MKVVFILAVLISAVVGKFVSYDGFKVYEIRAKNEEQLNFIASFATNKHFDFWSRPRILGLPTTVMVHPQSQEMFIESIDNLSIPYEMLIDNVEGAIQAEREIQPPRIKEGRISFRQYHRFNEIQSYLSELSENYPDIVELELFQVTYESHALNVVKIGEGGRNRPVILVECGIHAREWIAPATCLYIIQELVENENNRNMIENVDWYIIPILNPDGYEYTHTTDRFWRKTRLPIWDSECVGVDGNRNFDFHWMGEGSSSNPCADTYAGHVAFDQFETLGLKNVAYEYRNQTKLFLSVHSYGQYILYPWGYTADYPENANELQELAEQIEAAIAKLNGTRYTIGSTYNTMYPASGISPDWVTGYLGVELSYTIELPGGGQQGFDIPASRISYVVSETFEGIKAAHSYIENKFVLGTNNENN